MKETTYIIENDAESKEESPPSKKSTASKKKSSKASKEIKPSKQLSEREEIKARDKLEAQSFLKKKGLTEADLKGFLDIYLLRIDSPSYPSEDKLIITKIRTAYQNDFASLSNHIQVLEIGKQKKALEMDKIEKLYRIAEKKEEAKQEIKPLEKLKPESKKIEIPKEAIKKIEIPKEAIKKIEIPKEAIKKIETKKSPLKVLPKSEIEKKNKEISEELKRITANLESEMKIQANLIKDINLKLTTREEKAQKLLELLKNEKADTSEVQKLSKEADELDAQIGILRPKLADSEKKGKLLRNKFKNLQNKLKLATSLIKEQEKFETKLAKKGQELFSMAVDADKTFHIPLITTQIDDLMNYIKKNVYLEHTIVLPDFEQIQIEALNIGQRNNWDYIFNDILYMENPEMGGAKSLFEFRIFNAIANIMIKEGIVIIENTKGDINPQVYFYDNASDLSKIKEAWEKVNQYIASINPESEEVWGELPKYISAIDQNYDASEETIKCQNIQKKKEKGISLTKEQLKQWDICVEARRAESERKREEREWVSKQLRDLNCKDIDSLKLVITTHLIRVIGDELHSDFLKKGDINKPKWLSLLSKLQQNDHWNENIDKEKIQTIAKNLSELFSQKINPPMLYQEPYFERIKDYIFDLQNYNPTLKEQIDSACEDFTKTMKDAKSPYIIGNIDAFWDKLIVALQDKKNHWNFGAIQNFQKDAKTFIFEMDEKMYILQLINDLAIEINGTYEEISKKQILIPINLWNDEFYNERDAIKTIINRIHFLNELINSEKDRASRRKNLKEEGIAIRDELINIDIIDNILHLSLLDSKNKLKDLTISYNENTGKWTWNLLDITFKDLGSCMSFFEKYCHDYIENDMGDLWYYLNEMYFIFNKQEPLQKNLDGNAEDQFPYLQMQLAKLQQEREEKKRKTEETAFDSLNLNFRRN